MNKLFIRGLIILYLLLPALNVAACDVCGCAMGGTILGIQPHFNKNYVGMHYFYRRYSTEHSVSGSEIKSISSELFQTIELRGRFNISRRIQLFILTPLNINRQSKNSISSSFSGLGDITTFANYTVFNNGESLNSDWKHNFQIGGGIKLPTGSYNQLDKNNVLNQNIQTGTGSYDLLLDAIYNIRFNNWGLSNTAFYFYNTRNSNNYKFGNRFTVGTSIFYWADINGYSLLPSVGINYDNAKHDLRNSSIVHNSGGSSLSTTYALDFYYNNFTVGANCQIPIFQDNPVIHSKFKVGATLLYNF